MQFKMFVVILASLAGQALAGNAAAESCDAKIGRYCPPGPSTLVKGRLVGGGGLDNYSLRIRPDHGPVINAYCTTHCGGWFTEPDRNDVVKLKRSLFGKAITARIATERNNGRLAGPGDDDMEVFIKSATIGD